LGSAFRLAVVAADHAAGDFCAGVAGWLGGKIVRHIVDHYRPAEDVADAETACFYCQVGVAVTGHQRRQISGVGGVRCFGGVVVAQCVGKIVSRTAVSCVDVEAEEASFGGGQPSDGGLYQNAMLPLMKEHLSAQLGVGGRAADDGYGAGWIWFLLHILTSRQYMRPAAGRCEPLRALRRYGIIKKEGDV